MLSNHYKSIINVSVGNEKKYGFRNKLNSKSRSCKQSTLNVTVLAHQIVSFVYYLLTVLKTWWF